MSQNEFKITVNQFFRTRFSFFSVPEDVWHPLTDIYETSEGIVVRIELAGVERDNIQILIEGRSLIVQGIRRDPADKEKIAYHQMEINYGPFRSVFSLPFPVKAKEVKAFFKDGFLEIELPCCSEPFDEIVLVEIQ